MGGQFSLTWAGDSKVSNLSGNKLLLLYHVPVYRYGNIFSNYRLVPQILLFEDLGLYMGILI